MDDEDLTSGFVASLFRPPALLPISKHRDELLYVVENHQVTILIGQTGSGKTTQVPQMLEHAGWANGKVVAVTQPRRVAATSVAARVADEMRCQLGEQVGYSIRFEDVTSAKTRIKFLTDGLLLREALVDPLLSRYSVIMVDEAHERSLSTDLLLGVLKKIMKKRPELRVIISSATIQAEEMIDFFSEADAPAKVVYVSGRAFPVDILHLETATDDYVARAVHTIFDIHSSEGEGDILVFLTGQQEIYKAIQEIADRQLDLGPNAPRLKPVALYAGLSTDVQMAAFEPAPENMRKVVLATNIAEASVTIDGIVFVIDPGFVKLRAFNPATGIDALVTVPVSKASAVQRAGRAGRTRPGKCFRLYSEGDFSALRDATIPEIQRSNLAPTILQLKALGIDNVARFDFLTPPPAELIIRGLDLLYSLGALDDYAKLTQPLGMRMAELSIEPQMAKVLLSAPEPRFRCASEMLTIAAMTQLQGNVWFDHGGDSRKAMEASRRKFAAEEGDHLTLLNVYTAFVGKGKREAKWCRDHHLNFKSLSKAVSIRNQLRRYLERFGISVDEGAAQASAESICRCLASGYFAQAVRMQPDGSFKTVNGGTTLYAHPTSLMFNRKADWVVFYEVLETGDKAYIRDITKIERGWLIEYAPEYYRLSR